MCGIPPPRGRLYFGGAWAMATLVKPLSPVASGPNLERGSVSTFRSISGFCLEKFLWAVSALTDALALVVGLPAARLDRAARNSGLAADDRVAILNGGYWWDIFLGDLVVENKPAVGFPRPHRIFSSKATNQRGRSAALAGAGRVV